MGIVERIKEIEAEMARTQKNKATGFSLHYITYRCIDIDLSYISETKAEEMVS